MARRDKEAPNLFNQPKPTVHTSAADGLIKPTGHTRIKPGTGAPAQVLRLREQPARSGLRPPLRSGLRPPLLTCVRRPGGQPLFALVMRHL